MAINFPASPSEGDLYSYNGTNYTFDGVKWVSGGATVFLQKAGDICRAPAGALQISSLLSITTATTEKVF